MPERGSEVKAIQSMSRPQKSGFSRGGQLYDPTSVPHESVKW